MLHHEGLLTLVNAVNACCGELVSTLRFLWVNHLNILEFVFGVCIPTWLTTHVILYSMIILRGCSIHFDKSKSTALCGGDCKQVAWNNQLVFNSLPRLWVASSSYMTDPTQI